ncbi:MAG: hypothetical protein NC924_01715 [Candidatus Omnitrophica bacterium]|nr:hypothetical protein [Candidatus Omnitrophota bacterium]
MAAIMLIGIWTAHAAAAEPDPEQKISAFEAALSRSPGDRQAVRALAVLYHQRAAEYAQVQEWPAAIAQAEKAAQLLPSERQFADALAVLYNNYGVALQAGGDTEQAIAYFERGLRYSPGQLPLQKNMAVAYVDAARAAFEKKEYARSESLLQRARGYDVESVSVYVLSGEIFYARDDLYNAQAAWEKALARDPNFPGLSERLRKLEQEKKRESNYRTRESGNFRIKFEAMEKQGLAEAVLDFLRQAYRDIGREYNCYPGDTITVIIYPAPAFRQWAEFPDWAAGVYDGKIRLSDDAMDNPVRMREILAHEYTHALIYTLAGAKVPLWVQEGLAEYSARQFRQVEARRQRRQLLFSAARQGSLLDFADLAEGDLRLVAGYPREKINLMYAQSESMCDFMIQRLGIYRIREVLESAGKGKPFADAFAYVCGRELAEEIAQWRRSLDEP